MVISTVSVKVPLGKSKRKSAQDKIVSVSGGAVATMVGNGVGVFVGVGVGVLVGVLVGVGVGVLVGVLVDVGVGVGGSSLKLATTGAVLLSVRKLAALLENR